eukprot:6181910-Pleurochrysis_carterae.AAC.3
MILSETLYEFGRHLHQAEVARDAGVHHVVAAQHVEETGKTLKRLSQSHLEMHGHRRTDCRRDGDDGHPAVLGTHTGDRSHQFGHALLGNEHGLRRSHAARASQAVVESDFCHLRTGTLLQTVPASWFCIMSTWNVLRVGSRDGRNLKACRVMQVPHVYLASLWHH